MGTSNKIPTSQQNLKLAKEKMKHWLNSSSGELGDQRTKIGGSLNI